MPRFALHLIEHLYEIDPPNNPLTAVSLGMRLGIDGVGQIPHVFFNPGRWFSFVGVDLAGQLPWQPRAVTQDPVPVYLSGHPVPIRHQPARDIRDRYGATCEFGEAVVQLHDLMQPPAYTVQHRLFARFATTRVGSVYDSALVLGLSFLMHNYSEVQLHTPLNQFAGFLALR